MKNYDMLAHPNYRYIATIIDGAIVFILNIPLMYYISTLDQSVSIPFLILFLLFLYRSFIYLIFDFIIPICTNGQTIGRKLFGLRLIKDDFSKADWKNYLKRASLFVVLAFMAFVLQWTTLSYILWVVIFVMSIILLYNDARRKTIHDYFGKTVVVYDKQFQESAE